MSLYDARSSVTLGTGLKRPATTCLSGTGYGFRTKDSSSSMASLFSWSTLLISFSSRWILAKSLASCRLCSVSAHAASFAFCSSLMASILRAFFSRAASMACSTRSCSSACSSRSSWISLFARPFQALNLASIFLSRLTFMRSISRLFSPRSSACFLRNAICSCSRLTCSVSYSILRSASWWRFRSSSALLLFSNSASLALIAAERFRVLMSSPSMSAIAPEQR
mmetsp:Transcript_4309/g.11690  ORF Transcript_4309/g.11690 Transcript_4309/m.11690 type:complete len:224 (+) Transcript_4309:475-1146(+)